MEGGLGGWDEHLVGDLLTDLVAVSELNELNIKTTSF